jgi:hypothetical protein
MKGFNSFISASATLKGIKVAYMIRERQFDASDQSALQRFAALAEYLFVASAMEPLFATLCDSI